MFLGTFSLIAVQTAAADEKPKTRIEKRKENQKKRIAEGVKSGELTEAEAAKLKARERELNQDIKRDRKDGAGMTARERAIAEKRQDRISKDIAKEKHDAQKKP